MHFARHVLKILWKGLIIVCLTEGSLRKSFDRSSCLVVAVITTMFKGLQKVLKVSEIQTDSFNCEGLGV